MGEPAGSCCGSGGVQYCCISSGQALFAVVVCKSFSALWGAVIRSVCGASSLCAGDSVSTEISDS